MQMQMRDVGPFIIARLRPHFRAHGHGNLAPPSPLQAGPVSSFPIISLAVFAGQALFPYYFSRKKCVASASRIVISSVRSQTSRRPSPQTTQRSRVGAGRLFPVAGRWSQTAARDSQGHCCVRRRAGVSEQLLRRGERDGRELVGKRKGKERRGKQRREAAAEASSSSNSINGSVSPCALAIASPATAETTTATTATATATPTAASSTAASASSSSPTTTSSSSWLRFRPAAARLSSDPDLSFLHRRHLPRLRFAPFTLGVRVETRLSGPDQNGDQDHDQDDEDMTANGDGPPKKKQKRNKPTLSCHECVERKTKVISPAMLGAYGTHATRPCGCAPTSPDFELSVWDLSLGTWARSICDFVAIEAGRIAWHVSIKRQTDCTYALVANLLEETTRSAANGRRMTRPPKKKAGSTDKSPIPNIADRGMQNDRSALSRGAVSLSIGLLSNVPYSLPTASNVFGIGSEHPFANYWTCEGGLPEVISVLPEKIQADILLGRYFECVDPVYPMIHRQTFYADYEHFWQLAQPEKNDVDASFIALIFVMLALGTQFVTTGTSPRERKQTAEFYASASNQALRMSKYLSTASLRSVQAMVLMTYFLINDNHASDGWAFAGILIRQAYAMGLHRDPNIVTPNAPLFEKQQRRKLWQAVLLQDTFLTVLLSLPPSATHTDVSVEDLLEDGSSIANSDPTDTAYIRGSWTLANLVQETICSPRSLDLPICTTPRHKSKLVADFRAVYRSFPDVFRSWDPDSITALSKTNPRVVRQTLFLTSNYFHNLMLVHASECPDVPVNVRATLEAAHDAISAFFLLFSLLETEARVWWVFNHRAFLEALAIGNVLREAVKGPGGSDLLARDPLFVRARADISEFSHSSVPFCFHSAFSGYLG
ncbi:hypothetical protein G7046_g9689 [Stylonectria norvegica]|nr:hypothetical protein G7046_g9689 [Stylonectria norvegica]